MELNRFGHAWKRIAGAVSEAGMDKSHADRAAELCREAAKQMQNCGTFRFRVLMQMVIAELEKERAVQSSATGNRPSSLP